MKPHALRRGLWLANLALGAAVVGVGAWYALEVRPAVASVVNRPKNARPKALEELRAEYEKARVSGLKWKPQAPVSDPELNKTILRADYKKKNPTHWVFSGPLPPAEEKRKVEEKKGPPPPQGLDVLGKVSSVITAPPNSTILFKFKGGKSRAFGVGDFVQLASSDPARFRITKILEPRPSFYEIHYDVFGADKDKPERSAVLTYDRTGDADSYPPFLRPNAPQPADVPQPPDAPAAAPGDGTGDGTGEGTGEGTGDGAKPEEKPEEGGATNVVKVEPVKVPDRLSKDDIELIEVDSRRKIIKPKRTTYEYFKTRKAESVAKQIKTAVAKDPSTGQVIGLRITGLAPEAPTDAFDVRKGDILVSINGQKVASRADAVRIAQNLKDAKVVTVVIDRRGQLVTYRVDAQDPRNRRKVRYFEGFGE